MTTTATDPTRTFISSPDGTEIAVFVSGQGRPLVMVPGTTSDHSTWRLALPHLEPHVTVHAVDRRGRGASGDRVDYSPEQEYDDVAAVVDAVASATGSTVDLLGHSYGGFVALGAAERTSNIRRLVLYEGWPPPDPRDRSVATDKLAEIESLLSQGRPGQALETFYRDVVKMSDEEVSGIKAAPTWPQRVAAAGTVPREIRAFGSNPFDASRAARIRVPVLLLVGGDSPQDVKADPDIVANAFPDARVRVLEGQMHMAQVTAPRALADEVVSFLAA